MEEEGGGRGGGRDGRRELRSVAHRRVRRWLADGRAARVSKGREDEKESRVCRGFIMRDGIVRWWG